MKLFDLRLNQLAMRLAAVTAGGCLLWTLAPTVLALFKAQAAARANAAQADTNPAKAIPRGLVFSSPGKRASLTGLSDTADQALLALVADIDDTEASAALDAGDVPMRAWVAAMQTAASKQPGADDANRALRRYASAKTKAQSTGAPLELNTTAVAGTDSNTESRAELSAAASSEWSVAFTSAEAVNSSSQGFFDDDAAYQYAGAALAMASPALAAWVDAYSNAGNGQARDAASPAKAWTAFFAPVYSSGVAAVGDGAVRPVVALLNAAVVNAVLGVPVAAVSVLSQTQLDAANGDVPEPGSLALGLLALWCASQALPKQRTNNAQTSAELG